MIFAVTLDLFTTTMSYLRAGIPLPVLFPSPLVSRIPLPDLNSMSPGVKVSATVSGGAPTLLLTSSLRTSHKDC